VAWIGQIDSHDHGLVIPSACSRIIRLSSIICS
jgi:hypothetical protein